MGESPDYADYLAQEENVAGFRSRALDFYTLVFCVDFIGGAGMQFNRETTPAVSEGRKSELIEQFWILAAKFGPRR